MKKLVLHKNIVYLIQIILDLLTFKIKINKKYLYLKIKVKSFHPFYLNRFIVLVEKILKQNLLNVNLNVYLPKKIERFTVLTSPHVDKKARDQFEQRVYKRVFIFSIVGVQKKSYLYRFVRLLSSFAIGVEVKVEYIS